MNKLLNVSLAIAGLVIISACGGAADQRAEKINKLVDSGMNHAAKHTINKAKFAANKASVEKAVRTAFGRCNDADLEIISKSLKDENHGPGSNNGLSSECQKANIEVSQFFRNLGL